MVQSEAMSCLKQGDSSSSQHADRRVSNNSQVFTQLKPRLQEVQILEKKLKKKSSIDDLVLDDDPPPR